ncbi:MULTISPECIES: NAD(P)H-dependent oxidoreductase [unclassified Mesorhizobium]|uniref:NAD(P)H-dependent oxidoreductase n=1 Tax=unclassified Mesorhizobium TaxID=325217 RepID=UPI000FCBB816|nr:MULTISPECIES: NAD(P)H-dependent oxidoreductase [unclassified Mesorhizobium]RUV55179.1 flavodoxin family protein [Mesorhizobium sp. M5C.F.Ca.IN.020.29.1.1]RWB97312.1 MAG: flavodoxin family protein [Mesorhizobium sp.]RWI18553.1 MAG: flavodoxin family protein [Mesorhizobium sp.]RWK45207.1 MAG: flavodoxin family protein [Mesorhizobium sp.]RWK53555.1 MAG: flavodoxin family protein [Mesorhizobium sp.]
MSRRILVVVGHPDPSPDRLCRGLAQAYAEGAKQAGHVVRQIDLAALNFPMLRTMQEFEHGAIPDSLKDAAGAIVWAEHIVFVFPLWLGTMPALLKAFLEQVMRPGTAFAYPDKGRGFTKTLLRGRSARLVVTMGMPSLLYQLWFLGHGIAGMRRSILHFVGISPVRETLFGMVAGASDATRAKWLGQMRRLGARAR